MATTKDENQIKPNLTCVCDFAPSVESDCYVRLDHFVIQRILPAVSRVVSDVDGGLEDLVWLGDVGVLQTSPPAVYACIHLAKSRQELLCLGEVCRGEAQQAITATEALHDCGGEADGSL